MSFLVTSIARFGAPKVFLVSFLTGASLVVPAVFVTNNLWNGAAKNKRIRTLETRIERQDATIALERAAQEALEPIYENKDAEIQDLRKENTRLGNLNANLASAKAGTRELVYVQGKKEKDAATSRGDQCAAEPVDSGLREFGNGSDFTRSAKLPTGP